MEIKKNGNNVNIYDEKKLILHIDKQGDIYTAINDSVRILARIKKISDTETEFSNVSLKRINSSGKMVKNTSQKWTRHYGMARKYMF